MNTRIIASITLLTMALMAAGVRADKPPTPAKPDFCVDLYKQLAAEKGNLFFSPFSIATALAMTSAGAAGTTDAEMAAVLHLNPDQAKRHAECAAWARSLNSVRGGLFRRAAEGPEISTVNAIWYATNVAFKKSFVDIATKEYLAEVRAADFAGNAPKAVKEVNDWVEDKTRGKIKDILDPRNVPPDTSLLLVNAIYFKADWASPFDAESTRDADFTLDGGEKIKTRMMGQTASFNFSKRDGFSALEMAYKGDRMSMLFLLPDQIDGLPEFEKKLSSSLVTGAVDALERQRVIVFVPKFHAETEYSLSETLQALGMRLAFTDNADFTGMSDVRPFFISAVIHKAFVDVDEKGTEAAAATVVGMRAGSAMSPKQPPVFRADHPFIYLIRDTQTGQILFAGRMADPRK